VGVPDVYTWAAWAVAALAFVLGAQVLGITGAMTLVVLAVVFLLWIGWSSSRRMHRRRERPDPRFSPTAEIFRDPASGDLTRVYVDPGTGERRYWTERERLR